MTEPIINNEEKIDQPPAPSYPNTPGYWLLRVLQGAIIGVGAILPGISGGVLCVIFGIYQPMMALLAHPFRTFKIYYKLLLPVLIGWIIGFVGLSRLVELMFKASYTLAVWFFIGLIVGMMPSLFKESGKEGRNVFSWISFSLGTAITLAILLIIKQENAISIQPNIWWFLVCGLFWGISLVIPGMSSSSFLIFLGLYEPMAAGIADLNLAVIVPLIAGIILIVFISARFINRLFKKHYSVAFHMIIGVVIASTLVIMPLDVSGVTTILTCIGCFIAGFLIAWLMDKVGDKIQSKKQKEEIN